MCIILRWTHLNLLLVLEEWGFQNVPQGEVLSLHIEDMTCGLLHALPMTWLHGFVGHQFQQRNHFIEVINSRAQVIKCLPFLQGTWETTTPEA